LTIAPTGEITSWHTREHKSAARSSESRVTLAIKSAPKALRAVNSSAARFGSAPKPVKGTLPDSGH